MTQPGGAKHAPRSNKALQVAAFSRDKKKPGAQRLPLAAPLPRAFLLYFLCLLNLLCLPVG